jgi:hypothetical protein
MFATFGIALGFRLFEKTRFFSPRVSVQLLNIQSIFRIFSSILFSLQDQQNAIMRFRNPKDAYTLQHYTRVEIIRRALIYIILSARFMFKTSLGLHSGV